MGKLVYMVADEGERIKEILRKNGCELLLGDGTMDYDTLAACDALIPGSVRVTSALLDKAPNLKIVSKFGVGMDRIDIDACTSHGVYAANTPTSNYVSVAEHAVALMLSWAKQICRIQGYMRGDIPDWKGARGCEAVELSGKTLSIIGFGNIGRRVARLVSCFDMNIEVFDPFTDASSVPEYVMMTGDMKKVLADGDFVSIHVSGAESTRHLIGSAELKMMKPSAVLINTTRGFVVDEEALIVALRDGTIAGAALDVFDEEPVSPGNPLLSMDNVIVTPHSAANTPEARMRAQEDCAENILECLDGRRPSRALNFPGAGKNGGKN